MSHAEYLRSLASRLRMAMEDAPMADWIDEGDPGVLEAIADRLTKIQALDYLIVDRRAS